MARQVIQLRDEGEWVIETPEGFIRFRRSSRAWHIMVDLPERMTIERGEERALEYARFMAKDGNGRLVPKYKILVPVVDHRGQLTAAAEPSVMRIAEPTHARNVRQHAVADVATSNGEGHKPAERLQAERLCEQRGDDGRQEGADDLSASGDGAGSAGVG